MLSLAGFQSFGVNYRIEHNVKLSYHDTSRVIFRTAFLTNFLIDIVMEGLVSVLDQEEQAAGPQDSKRKPLHPAGITCWCLSVMGRISPHQQLLSPPPKDFNVQLSSREALRLLAAPYYHRLVLHSISLLVRLACLASVCTCEASAIQNTSSLPMAYSELTREAFAEPPEFAMRCQCRTSKFHFFLLQANLRFINRNALACLLGLGDEGLKTKRTVIIDLRRHDERTLYGAIQGAAYMQ